MIRFNLFLLLTTVLFSCGRNDHSGLSVDNLKCNWLENPAGTGSEYIFTWNGKSISRSAIAICSSGMGSLM